MSKIPKDVVAALRAQFEQLPEAPNSEYSVRAAVAELRPAIDAARRKGYSLDAVLEMLSKTHPEFSKLSVASLRRYLSVAGGAKRSRRSASTAEDTARPRRRSAADPTLVPSMPEKAGAASTKSAPAAAPAAIRHAGLREQM